MKEGNERGKRVKKVTLVDHEVAKISADVRRALKRM